MKIKVIGEVIADPQLLSILKTAVQRAAHKIIATSPAPAQPLVEWAKRAHFTYKDDRVSYYASLILEAIINEDSKIRDTIDGQLTAGKPIEVEEADVTAAVQTFVDRFATLGI